MKTNGNADQGREVRRAKAADRLGARKTPRSEAATSLRDWIRESILCRGTHFHFIFSTVIGKSRTDAVGRTRVF